MSSSLCTRAHDLRRRRQCGRGGSHGFGRDYADGDDRGLRGGDGRVPGTADAGIPGRTCLQPGRRFATRQASIATSPPPTTTTVSGISGRSPAFTRRRNPTPSTTRSSSSPGIPIGGAGRDRTLPSDGLLRTADVVHRALPSPGHSGSRSRLATPVDVGGGGAFRGDVLELEGTCGAWPCRGAGIDRDAAHLPGAGLPLGPICREASSVDQKMGV